MSENDIQDLTALLRSLLEEANQDVERLTVTTDPDQGSAPTQFSVRDNRTGQEFSVEVRRLSRRDKEQGSMSETRPPVVVVNPRILGFGITRSQTRRIEFQDYHTGNFLSVLAENGEEAKQLLDRLVVVRIWEEFFTDATSEWLVKLPIQGEASDGIYGNSWDEGTAWEQARVSIVNTYFCERPEQVAGVGPVQALLDGLRKEQLQATIVASGVTFPTKVSSYETIQVVCSQGEQQVQLSLHADGYFDLLVRRVGSQESQTLMKSSLHEYLQ